MISKLIKSALWFVPASVLLYSGNNFNNTQVMEEKARESRIEYLLDTYPQYADYVKFRDAFDRLKNESGAKSHKETPLKLDSNSPINVSTNLQYMQEHKEDITTSLYDEGYKHAVEELHLLENQKEKLPLGKYMIGIGGISALVGLVTLANGLISHTPKQTPPSPNPPQPKPLQPYHSPQPKPVQPHQQHHPQSLKPIKHYQKPKELPR